MRLFIFEEDASETPLAYKSAEAWAEDMKKSRAIPEEVTKPVVVAFNDPTITELRDEAADFYVIDIPDFFYRGTMLAADGGVKFI